MKLTKKIENEIKTVMDDYWASYFDGNLEHWANYLVENYRNIGGTEEEIWSNKKEILDYTYRLIDQMAGQAEMRNKTWDFILYNPYIMVHEYLDLYVKVEEQFIFYQKFRLSSLIQKIDNDWKVLHQHGSYPDSKTQEGEAFAFDTLKNENLKLQQLVKSRTQELEEKNRELEIETALEKVRAIAMSMKEPADMLTVCETISQQLQSLGVNEIRNVQTAIFYESRGTYMNYEYYSRYKKNIITETNYTNHKIQKAFAIKMMKGKDEFFISHIKGKKVKEWLAYQKTTNVFIDHFLKEANSLNYYWDSLGPVALGISTYVPLTEEEINLFKRFRNVFELAYRRFLDIERAIGQAKEARIETALERVRAVAMAMRKPGDLLNICETLFNEFRSMEFDEIRNAMINIHNDEDRSFINYDYSDAIGKSTNHLLYNIHPLVEKQIKKIRSANDAFSETYFTGQDLEEWKKFRKRIGEKDDPRLDDNKGLYYYFYSIGIGSIGISTFGAINAGKIALLKRFRNVFSLCYQRYVDISLAEAQAKEARIETALERVRAVAMAMKKSDEVINVCEVMYKELQSLGFTNIRNAQIALKNDSRQSYSISVYSDNESVIFGEAHYHSSPIVKDLYQELEQSKDAFYQREFSGKKFNDWRKWRQGLSPFADSREASAASMCFYLYSIGIGHIGISTFNAITEIQIQMLKRFKNVFELCYTRYIDVAKAEVQAREAQIELALERVRARTMAMQHSEELADTSSVLFQQVKGLGFETWSCGFCTWQQNEIVEVWMGADSGGLLPPMKIPYKKEPTHHDIYKASLTGEESHEKTWEGKALEKHYNYLQGIPSVATAIKQLEDAGLLLPTRQCYYVGFFKQGYLLLITKEPNAEMGDISKRFAKVFEQAYTRFLDLQKAEAQARESQVEAAVERIRAQSMAMYTTTDLDKVNKELLNQLQRLNVDGLTGVSIYFLDEVGEVKVWDLSSPGNIGDPNSYNFKFSSKKYAILGELWEQFKNSGDYFTMDYPLEKLQRAVEEFKAIDINIANAVIEALESGNLKHQWNAFGKISGGVLGIDLMVPPSEDTKAIVLKMAGAFNIAYKRFIDLQKAEAQAREAQIELALERVRARTMAMQKSEELAETSYLLFQQLKELGASADQLSIGILNETEQTMDLSVTLHGSQLQKTYTIKLDEPFVVSKSYAAWKENKKSIVITLTGKDLEDYNAYRNSLSKIKFNKTDADNKWVVNCAFFSKGWMSFSSLENVPAETIKLLERFTAVFDGTYTRFLDLQKAEAQAREAQIETALERVRSRSMGMQKSEELKAVIKIVYQQLTLLKINLDHAGFVVDYTPGGNWHFWIADEQDIPSKITHPYFESVWAGQFDEAKETGADFFATHLNFEEKNKFYQDLLKHIPGLTEGAKEFYFSCPGLAASTVLLKNVGLYIENFEGIPYSDEDNAMLMRFGKVFQQTYTRFLDLQKAEAQAREAQIEAALERTRTQSMIMQHSNELDNTLRVFHEQVQLLGINSAFSFLWLPDEEKDKHIFWAIWEENKNGSVVFKNKAINYPLDRNEPATKQCLIDWKSDESVVSYAVPSKEVENYFAVWAELLEGVEKLKPEYFQNGLYYVEAFMKYGCFGIMVESDLTEDEKKILGRFAVEFERTYTRFLDLQKAEAQAREAQIETALEKVRSRTMAMQRSDELSGTAVILFQEFNKLEKQELIQITIGIYNEANNEIEFRATDWEGHGQQIDRPSYGSMEEPTLLKPAVTAWRAQAKSLVIDLTGDKLQRWVNYRNIMTGTTISSKDAGGRRVISIAFFSKGHLSLSSPLPLPAETVKTLERFAAVFDGTYTRFLDLQKAEAQARESQIETGLEKVRSRTLAMQKSDELAETAAEVFKQLIGLGIEPNRLYIGIIKDESGDMEMWATDEDGTQVGKKFMFNKNENVSVKKLYDGWAAKEKSVIVDMEGKELEAYFHYLNEVMHIPFKGGLTQKRRVQSVAYFSKGFIGMASPDGQGTETIQLLERFAALFNLTFTRFNDLKIAEAHAEQAEQDLIAIKEAKQKAEDALIELQATQKQLIQSEKMASLGELTAGIAHEIQNPLNFVNNFSEVSKELLDEMKTALDKGDSVDAKEIADDVIQNLEKINHHGKRADAIVKGMLQHSRSSSAIKEPTDINALADEYLRLSYHGLRAKDKSFNATMKTDFDNSIGNINMIPQDIGRVILNLFTNAFYAVDEKKKLNSPGYEPTVTISTCRSPLPGRGAGGEVTIKVRDNGNGIPQKVLDKIFQPFFTTKPTGKGTGLGLSLSYDIIKAHGGEIKVDTKEGEGTEFTIILPA